MKNSSLGGISIGVGRVDSLYGALIPRWIDTSSTLVGVSELGVGVTAALAIGMSVATSVGERTGVGVSEAVGSIVGFGDGTQRHPG